MADYRIFWGLVTDSRRIFAVFDSVVRKRNNHKTSAKKFQKCVSIIDCIEPFTARPLNLNARAQTWNTIQLNI